MSKNAYAAININNEIRSRSSSGAVFYELAKWVITNGGVVYGVKFSDDWTVMHSHCETINGIQGFSGSKYAQSDLKNEYKEAKEDLEEGRIVLFSGMPCQTEGLRWFLGKEYEKLITVDFICHGVPSPTIWQQYINWIANGREIKSINFRDKTEGWLDFSLKIDFQDGSFYRETQKKDLYMKGFLQNIYLRPSCYHCRFKGIERMSDITLADFWGVSEILPEMFDDMGTSLILIHSRKGMNLWNEVKNAFTSYEIDASKALSHNSAAFSSIELPPKRADFFSSGDGKFRTLREITRASLKEKIILKGKRILKKLIDKI